MPRVSKVLHRFCACIHGLNLSFAMTKAGALLVDGLPGNGAATPHDKVAAHRLVLEHGYFGALIDGRFHLGPPTGI